MPLHSRRVAIIAFLLLVTPVLADAQAPAPATALPAVRPHREVRAVRATSPLTLDGVLNEPAWERATPATALTQRDPIEGEPATETTDVRFVFDADALYIGARMADRTPLTIGRRLTRRDDDADDVADTIQISVSPLHDGLTGNTFIVSASGALSDAYLHNDTGDDESWDAVWDARVSVDDRGWSAELRIPFSQLRFNDLDPTPWGLNIVRTIVRRNEEAWWVPVPKNEDGFVSRMGSLSGLEEMKGKRHLDLMPYLSGRGEFMGTAEEGNPYNDGSRWFGGAGLDAKWGITSSLTLDATVNPDFGQVEVDPAVVNLSVFETYFDEKRPFFLEGAQTLGNFSRNGVNSTMGFNRSRPTLFYSRRIGRSPQGLADGDFVDMPAATTILGAAKLSGKTAGGWNIGLLEAATTREFARTWQDTGESKTEVEPLTNYLVARVRRDVGRRAGFGFLGTAVHRDLRTDALDTRIVDSALVGGIDGHVFFDTKKEWVVSSGLAWSRVDGSEAAISRLQRASARYFQRPDAEHITYDPSRQSLTGWDFQLDFNRNAGTFRPTASVWGVSPGFETNDVGYMTNADRYGWHAGFNWNKPTPDRLTRYRQLLVAVFQARNFDSELMSSGFWSGAWVTLPNYWSAETTLYYGRDGLNDRLTRGGPMMKNLGGYSWSAEVETDGRKRLVGELSGEYAASRTGSWNATGTISVSFRPTSALSFEAGPSWMRAYEDTQYVAAHADVLADTMFGTRYVFGALDHTEVSMTLRANWIVSPRMSLQLYAQPLLSTGNYNDFKEAVRPRTYEFARYGSDTGSIAFDSGTGTYHVTPVTGTGATAMQFGNPDFNFKSLRVNAVYRWEFQPGSTFYFVWTQTREDYGTAGRFDLGSDMSHMFRAPGDNILMAKLSYWFSR